MQGSGSVTSFGIVGLNGNAVEIEQYTIYGGSLEDIDSVATPTTGVSQSPTAQIAMVTTEAGGGIEASSIYDVGYFTLSTGTRNSAVIAYLENGTSNRNICIVDNDGTDFNTDCSTKITVSTTLDIQKIYFADVEGDTLTDLVLLLGDGATSNAVYVYENRGNTVAGLYNLADTITLKSFDSNVDIALEDLNAEQLLKYHHFSSWPPVV